MILIINEQHEKQKGQHSLDQAIIHMYDSMFVNNVWKMYNSPNSNPCWYSYLLITILLRL